MHSVIAERVISHKAKFIAVSTLPARSGFLAIGMLVLQTCDASALPAFADQTGQRCGACHIGGLGPQLTPFGREFKLGGYTLRKGPGFTMPLAAMVVASYVQTQKDQDSPPAPHYGS